MSDSEEVEEVVAPEVAEEEDVSSQDYDGDDGEDIGDGIEPEAEDLPEDAAEEEEFLSSYARMVEIVPADERTTTDVMSKGEMCECVSIRATQISKYNNCMVECDDLHDAISMAKFELMQRKCPLTIRRKVGDVLRGDAVIEFFEEWNPNTMIFSEDYVV